MKISDIPRPERERNFWEVVEARKRNGVLVTQADADLAARALESSEWDFFEERERK